MAKLRLDLSILDVHGRPVADPRVLVRLAPPDGVGAVTATVALHGGSRALEVADGPAGPALILRVTPSLYRDGAITCTVDGSGLVTPMAPIVLPRRSSHWQPAFARWAALGADFSTLRDVLGVSPAFRVGQFSEPVTCTEGVFDGIDAADESRSLAKVSLLNLFGRLRQERAPGAPAPWFAHVRELLLATRERFIAEVDEACWKTVTSLAATPKAGYRPSPVKNHLANFRAVPGVTSVGGGASVKTTERKANLQFSVVRARRDGREAFLLDADIDEHGGLLLHTFDVIKHAFTGGTHPVDVHECLCASFPQTDLGYHLEPMGLLPVPRGLVARAHSGARRSTPVPAAAPAAGARPTGTARRARKR
jgi:hypothetical protein